MFFSRRLHQTTQEIISEAEQLLAAGARREQELARRLDQALSEVEYRSRQLGEVHRRCGTASASAKQWKRTAATLQEKLEKRDRECESLSAERREADKELRESRTELAEARRELQRTRDENDRARADRDNLEKNERSQSDALNSLREGVRVRDQQLALVLNVLANAVGRLEAAETDGDAKMIVREVQKRQACLARMSKPNLSADGAARVLQQARELGLVDDFLPRALGPEDSGDAE